MINIKTIKRILSLTLIFVLSLTALTFAYIGNARSGIFHYDDCRYVYRMNENNKVYFDTREEAIDYGYRPCKVCNP